jgi:ureidoglycolate lyase
MKILKIPVLHATAENTKDYGLFIGTDVPDSGLTIPFYKGSVEEGHNFPFQYHEKAVARTARIHPRSGNVQWLERHLRMTQVFVGLGDAPLGLVLGKPNHAAGKNVPDLEDLVGFILPPGHGIMIHLGTWHDFPMALERPVTVLTLNSEEVVAALAAQKAPGEMNHGDVFKIHMLEHVDVQIQVNWL